MTTSVGPTLHGIARYRSHTLLRVYGHLPYMCTSFAGHCDEDRRQVSSFGNLALHNLRLVFQRFETWAAMSHYYLCAKDSLMVASMHEASRMYQRATRTFRRAERHASHFRI